MARNITLAQLRTEIRNRGEYRSPSITDAEIDAYINDSLAHLYDLLSEIDQSRYMSSDNISVVAATESYSLPADFYRSINFLVPSSNSPTGFVRLERIEWSERYDHSVTVSTSKENSFYAIRGTSVYIWPIPGDTYTAKLEYVQSFQDLTQDSDTFDGVNGWDEWAVCDTLIKCANRFEDDSRGWEAQRQSVQLRMLRGGKQDRSRPRRVIDVRGGGYSRGRPGYIVGT